MISPGVGTTGASLGMEGGSAHWAGLESRKPQRQAWVIIEETQAWIWYMLRGARPRAWCAPYSSDSILAETLHTATLPRVG